MFQKCIMCNSLGIHWLCVYCEKRFSIHHPSVIAKIERYRLKLKLDKEFNNA